MLRVSFVLLIVGLCCCSLELAYAKVNPIYKVQLQERLCAVDSRYCEGLIARDETKNPNETADIVKNEEDAEEEEEQEDEGDQNIGLNEKKTDLTENNEDEEADEGSNIIGLENEDFEDNSNLDGGYEEVVQARARRLGNKRRLGRAGRRGRRRNMRGRRRGRGRGRGRRRGRRAGRRG